MAIPKKLQPVLWSTKVDLLDSKKDKYYIIHQIFAYGSLTDIKWLFENYSKKDIIRIFKSAFKDYRRSRFYFVKNILLDLKNWKPDEKYYVKNTPRVIG
ncbi:hypothetical protein HYT02_03395 [Candidatus Gottesmanbacteria bacterium]|nr:hypothetical protein [Candidatus Gottesmanbacteria bacterium]